MARGTVMIVAVLAVMVLPLAAGDDWGDIVGGLAGARVPFPNGFGTPDMFTLRGSAFPVVLTTNNPPGVGIAAARVGDKNGRVVAINKEAHFQACYDATVCSNGQTGKFLAQILAWVAAGSIAPGSTTIRAASQSWEFGASGWANLKAAAQAALGLTLVPPTNATSFILEDPTKLGARADVYIGSPYPNSFTADGRAALATFVANGGGLILGGQAWSSSGGLSNYGGNLIMAQPPFNSAIQWTANYGGCLSNALDLPASAPSVLKFNTDAAAKALLAHMDGTGPVLDASTLSSVLSVVESAINSASPFANEPAGSTSAALWAGYTSSLAQFVLSNAAKQDCTKALDSTVPANRVAVAYLAKAQADNAVAAVGQPFPCISSFPGLPKSGATATTRTVSLNLVYDDGGAFGSKPMPPRGGSRWVSTGLWAPAGVPITVTLPAALAALLPTSGTALGLQIGSHTDSIMSHSTWARLPRGMVQRFWFSKNTTSYTYTSGVGGLVHVLVGWRNTFGQQNLDFSGVLLAPVYIKGVTTAADWTATRATNPAPWGEIAGKRVVVTVQSSFLATVPDAGAVADMWDAVADVMADMVGFAANARPREERIVLDVDISAGWLHSGYPVMGFVAVSQALLTVDVGQLNSLANKWGFVHELGHNHQWGAWTLPRTGETTNNLLGIAAGELALKSPRTGDSRFVFDRRARDQAYFATGSWSVDWTVWVALDTYLQLQENVAGAGNFTGGWDFYRRVLRRYQDLEGTADVATDNLKVQTWIYETSRIAGKDLSGFYTAWKFPVDSVTVTKIAALNLPPFDFSPTAVCTTNCAPSCCMVDSPPAVNPTPAADFASLTNGFAGTNLSFPAQGQTGSLGGPGVMMPLIDKTEWQPFPYILTADGLNVAAAAARPGAGRMVAFFKEGVATAACGVTQAACNGPTGRLIINALRWAGGKPIPTAQAPQTLRVGVLTSGVVSSKWLTQIKTAASGLSLAIIKPTGGNSNHVIGLSSLGSGTAAAADVVLVTAYQSYSDSDRQKLTGFVLAGGGLVIGGQGWSYSGASIDTFPGNVLLGPRARGGLGVMRWTSGSVNVWYPTRLPVAAAGPPAWPGVAAITARRARARAGASG